jgi:nucleotide-binding universal stress UspA family protein
VAASDRRRIVVGVDGSPAAHTAVGWAAEQARELGRELVLLHGREEGRPAAFPAMPPAGDAGDRLVPYREELGDLTTLSVRREIVDAPPSRALVDASAEAVMLVLGRPRGRLRSWPGPTSVTRRVLTNAACPVVLVPERRRDTHG